MCSAIRLTATLTHWPKPVSAPAKRLFAFSGRLPDMCPGIEVVVKLAVLPIHYPADARCRDLRRA